MASSDAMSEESVSTMGGLLGGEIIVASVRRVLRYNTGVLASGEYGVLLVTNFRIVFVGAEREEVCPDFGWVSPEEENRSIPLTSVAQLYSTVKGSSSSVFTKQRIPLSTQTKLSTVDGIEVVTKDCFVHRFGVQFVNGSERLGPPSGRRGRRSNTKDTPLKKLIATLVRHSQPSTRTNFFAFDYAPEGRVTPGILDTEITNFKAKEHAVLDMEMMRCGIKGDGRWHIAQNLQFVICSTYPALVVLPSIVSDDMMVTAGKMGWQDGRFPVWRWSFRKTGAWMARSFQRLGSDETDVAEIVKAFEDFGEVAEIDTTECCCTAVQAEAAFAKLFDACGGGSDDSKGGLDSGWMATFSDTRWPQLLQASLRSAAEGASHILGGTNVLVTGATGSLTDAVVCSLIQVILDPFRRTRRGFDELVRSEWETLGFPLIDGALGAARRRPGQHALFTLFLDAVHQIMVQFPLRWEFTDSYLVHMWRTSFSGLHSSFLFDSEKERMCSEFFRSTPFWEEAAPASTERFWHPFVNVLYSPTEEPALPGVDGPLIRLWAHCYLPQSAGRQHQDERAIREQVHARLSRIGTTLARGGGDLATEISKLNLPSILAAVVHHIATTS